MIAAVVYATLYYLIVFNICFDGISRESVKKSGLLNNALGYLKVNYSFICNIDAYWNFRYWGTKIYSIK